MRPLFPLLIALAGCKALEEPLPGPEQIRGPTAQVLDRGLEIPDCRGVGAAPAIGGVWVFAFETASTLSGGNLDGAQLEIVTRYGVATACQDDREVELVLMVCNLAQTPVFDDARTCAAQLPSTATLAALPAVRVRGTLGSPGPSTGLVLEGWAERWGLVEGGTLPPEPPGVGTLEDAALVDLDGDDDPGVTLTGDSSVPSITWAARLTEARFELTAEEGQLAGRVVSNTSQTIVGGPATRLIRGRARAPRPGGAAFVRADGRLGSPRADANGDGVVRCGEIGGLVAQLPPPAAPACGR